MKKLATLLVAPWMALIPALAAAALHDAEVAAVRALYARYAAEAVLNDTSNPTLATAPRAVLQQHFTDDLARLWLRDRACVARKREICRIDFAPLWDSQDPVGTVVTLSWDASQSRVVASLRRGDGAARALAYALQHSPAGWRIADIGYGDKRSSLRQLLAAPEPR